MKKNALLALVTAMTLLAGTSSALAWGTKGHEIINHLAAASFPKGLPAFLRSSHALYAITYLGPELDRLKGAGRAWDADYDPGHYLDLLDNGTVDGLPLTALPPTREAYDTALRARGSDQYREGYLPYSLLEGWQQLREDFAYWRVDEYRHDTQASAVDQALIIRDVGVWGHFVADASQPLHVTVHFNGWGRYPNPHGYTQSPRTHELFESVFVDQHITQSEVAALINGAEFPAPQHKVSQSQTMAAISRYLQTTSSTVPQLYQIQKAGGFARGSAAAVHFTASRLAAGANELRELVVWAWRDSLNVKVGYPAQNVRAILSGKVRVHLGD